MNARAFDQLIGRWRAVSATLPDRRTGDNTRYTMADIASAAFAVFFTQCPSFLSYQQNMEHARAVATTRAPCSRSSTFLLTITSARRLIRLNPANSSASSMTCTVPSIKPVCSPPCGRWQTPGSSRWTPLGIFRPNPKTSIARAVPASTTPTGQVTHFHSAITPIIVSPGHKQVVSLRPEFITPQDGQVKQDCEINAAKRWLAAHAGRYSTGNDTLLGDDLYAHQPFCRQVLLHGFHFLFTCKPASHSHLSQWVEALEPGRDLHIAKLKVKGQSNRWEHHQYRWANGVPLTDSDDALQVNWCDVTVTDDAGQILYRNAFITDWQIRADTVAGWVAAGRARWKIENENNNVLKNRGYHLEHNFGHGKEHLASVLLTLNLLAFALHTLLELTDESYRLIRTTVGARRKFFTHLEALTTYLYFESWERLMDFMLRGLEIGPYAVPKN